MDIQAVLSSEFQTAPAIIGKIVSLIDEGNTIPFIARYRKEMTGAMDDQKLREISERLDYLRGLDKRREPDCRFDCGTGKDDRRAGKEALGCGDALRAGGYLPPV